ncbi:MAG: hypothetical protein ACYDEV_00190 [Acidiferrobacter sp.]
MSTPLDIHLSWLDKVRKSGREYEALCPAHDDHNPSLGIKKNDDGSLLVKCRVGCATRDELATVGLGMPDLNPEHPIKGRRGNTRPDPEAAERIAKAKSDRQEKRKKS